MRSASFARTRWKCTSWSLIAEYMRTGALTRPNEIAPVQSARGMLGGCRAGAPSNVRELHLDVLVRPPLLDLRPLPQRALVAGNERLLAQQREAARPQRAHAHDVDLGGD